MILTFDGVRLPVIPTKKLDLQAYFIQLTFSLERELVEVPEKIAELRVCCREMQKHCVRCNVEVPIYDERMKEYVE